MGRYTSRLIKPRKTFVLGVGAQKAGTSWLFQYMRSLRYSKMPDHKEFHVWDALDSPKARKYLGPDIPRHAHDARVREMVDDPDVYFDYFCSHFSEGRITGDITPNYAGLSVERLRMIEAGFAERGVRVKSVLLLRDPVSRCVSAFRMVRARRDERKGRTLTPEQMESMFLRYAMSEECEVRTRYERTWLRNDEVMGTRRVHVELFEQLFTESAMNGLDRFLGSYGWHGKARQYVNPGNFEQKWIPSLEARTDVARNYRSTYDFVVGRRPEVQDLWSGYTLL